MKACIDCSGPARSEYFTDRSGVFKIKIDKENLTMTIQMTQNEISTVLAIEGRIDTNTSPALQSEILKAFQMAKTVILDFANVSYISSAGLRSLLE